MTDTYLKSWLDRVENLEAEQKGIGSDKRDLYAEAKGRGYNPKALRRIVAARKRKDEDEIEADVDTYKVALGMAVEAVQSGVSLRKAAKAFGVSKSSVHRGLAVPAVSQTPATPPPAEVVSTANAPEEMPVAEVKESTAGPEQGAASNSPPPNDAPQAERIEEPSATPAPAAGAEAGTQSDEWEQIAQVQRDLNTAYRTHRST